jgi:hypothetical protein
MDTIVRDAPSSDALIVTYRGGAHPEQWGKYADCFCLTVRGDVTLRDFLFAFYTSKVFRVEALVLRVALGAPSGTQAARDLADGVADKFAAWYVAQRTDTQLLLSDRFERTRSWFRVVPNTDGSTRLLFGSALAGRDAPRRRSGFSLLLWFHVAYSRALLRSAATKLAGSQ